MKKILILVLAVGLVVGYYAYNQYSKPVDKIDSLTAVATLDAAQLFSDFESDEKAANTKYLDQVIVAKGKVISSEVVNEKTTVYLETDDMMGTILCQLESIPAQLPEKGTTVSIKGVCSGFLSDVVLVRAKIIK